MDNKNINDGLSNRIPPQSIKAEMAVLGAMFLDKNALEVACDKLQNTDFYKPIHGKIFKSTISIYDRNEAVDIITISEQLRSENQLEEIGGSYYLTELVEYTTTSAKIEYHVSIVKEKARLRKLITISNNMSCEAYSNSKSQDIINEGEQALYNLQNQPTGGGFKPFKNILIESFDNIENIYSDSRNGFVGISSGFEKLDQKIGGFQKSDLIIIAGRPSMGKTSLALNIIFNVVKRNIPVGMFSLEMPADQLANRILCSNEKIESHALQTGRSSENDRIKLYENSKDLAGFPLYIDDSPSLNLLQLCSRARRLKSEKHVELLVIDYLQLLHKSAKYENRQQEIADISRSLKILARELEIPIITISQLSRAVESRNDKRPFLSDLRDSGAIEQDADLVLLLYRPEVYFKDEDKAGEAEVIIAKHRNGPTGTIKLRFVDKYTSFENLTKTI